MSNPTVNPANMHSMLAAPAHTARVICDQESLPGELDILHSMFKINNCNDRSTGFSIHLRWKINLEWIQPSVAFLPFVGPIFSHISRVQSLCNTKTIGFSTTKVSSSLQPVKGVLGLKTPGIYSTPCECDKVYIR
jgi:hypothetical protein